MSAVFGPQDIAALVAAFPPPLSDGRPSLVRSSAGDALIDFESAVERVQSFFRDSQVRIPQGDLPAVLNIEPSAVSTILRCLSRRPVYSSDGQSIIPEAEVGDIANELITAARSTFVDCVEFSQSSDISLDDLLHLLDSSESHTWKRFPKGQNIYVCDSHHLEETVSGIENAIGADGSGVGDLTAVTAGIPPPIYEDVVRGVVGSVGAEIRWDGGRGIFVPNVNEAAKSEQPSHHRAKQIEGYLSELEQKSYCVIEIAHPAASVSNRDDVVQSVITEYGRSHTDGPRLSVVDTTSEGMRKAPRHDGPVTRAALVISHEALVRCVDGVKEAIVKYAEKIWLDGDKHVSPTDLTLNVHKYHESSAEESGLVEFLTRTNYMREFEELAQDQIAVQENKDHLALVELVNERLVAPLQLHIAAIATALDPNLRQNLQEFVLDYFRTHYVALIGQDASAKGLLADKSRMREFDRLRQACQQARTLEDVQASVQRLTRKTKIPNPGPQTLDAVKKRCLENALRSEIRRSATPSVILQNTIWILLAQKSEGIFVSAGKDTSRMIKQYQAVGDVETARKLLHWRDLAKTGQMDNDVLTDMRITAKVALQAMYGEAQAS